MTDNKEVMLSKAYNTAKMLRDFPVEQIGNMTDTQRDSRIVELHYGVGMCLEMIADIYKEMIK